MADDLTFGVKLTGDGSSLRGELVASREELERLKSAAGGTQVETTKLSGSTEQLAKQQHSAAASGKSLSESGGLVAAELLKAAGAAMAYQQIVLKSIAASNEYTAAIMGLASAARFSGEDIDATLNKAVGLTTDGLMSTSEAALALKNLLSRGFTADQAIEMINRLKDSAAFGKQASLEFGQAVVSATEGLKNENSILVDNAGVTKNVSVMWKEYAAQIGVTVDSLSQAQKREAEYSGIMRETEGQMGNSALAADSLMGATARMNKAANDAAIAFGQALTPAATLLADSLAWASENAIKPMIFGVQGIGIVAGTTAAQVGVFAEFMTSPSAWNSKGIESYSKQLEALGELGDQMMTELAAKLNGEVAAPNIGKDSGARRQDVPPAADTEGMTKLLDEIRKFDDQMVASHDDAFTKTINGWVTLQDKMIAAGAYGANEREAHEAAYTAFVSAENEKRNAAADEQAAKLLAKQAEDTANLVAHQNVKFAALQQQADAAGMNDTQRAEAKYQRELAELEQQRAAISEATKNDRDLQLAELELFEQAKLNITTLYEKEVADIKEKEDKRASDTKGKYQKLDMDSAAYFFGSLKGLMNSESRAMFEIGKAAAISETVINTYQSATASYKALAGIPYAGPYLGAAAAAAAVVSGLAQVSAIQSTSFGSSGGSAASYGGATSAQSGGDATTYYPSTPTDTTSSQQVVQVTIYNTGNVLSADYIDSTIIPQIKDSISNSDVILIDPRSRQAAMLATSK